MLDEPVYLRPPDYRYCLRSQPYYWWFTGSIRGDRQLLLVAGYALEFDRAGRLLDVRERQGDPYYPIPRSLFPAEIRDRGCPDEQAGWVRELGFEECPVLVRRFWLPERWLGVSDLPWGQRDLHRDPSAFDPEEAADMRADAASWIESGMFAFNCGNGETYIGRDGECLASPA